MANGHANTYHAFVSRRGFTIVELLIVIVVIAILAAVTIVAYNGIQDRAKASAAQSAASQASKKVMTYAVLNADQFPADLATAGVTDSGDTTFQYSVNNSTTPKTYCITTTTTDTSYYVSNTQPTPVTGGCPGHGVGGVAAITNLAINPSAETNSTGWSGFYGDSGAGTQARQTTGGMSGTGFYRVSWTTAPTGVTSNGIWIVPRQPVAAAGGRTFQFSGYIRSSWTGAQFFINVIPLNSSFAVINGGISGTTTVITPNTWTRLSALYNGAPAGTEHFDIRLRLSGSGTLPAVGSTMDADAFMISEGSTLYNFADGNSSGWAWSSTVNNSTSTGVPL